jgi:hypothetical protein
MTTRFCFCLTALLLAGACSTRPRDFEARLSARPANQDVFTRDFAMCKLLVDRGIKGQFKDQLAANSAAAAGLAAGGVATSVAISSGVAAVAGNTVSAAFGQVGTATGSATASTLAVAAPMAGILVSVAIAQAVKGKREKQVKAAMTNCLSESGYFVTGWTPDNRVMALPANLPTDTGLREPAGSP